MIINPIIPIWLMGIICIIFLFIKRKNRNGYIRQIIIIILIFIINTRIMIKSSDVPNIDSNLNILFVIDNTMSMLAEDYNGNNRRIDAVKSDCKYIIENLSGANFSVIAFDNSARTVTPYTSDVGISQEAIKSLNGQTKLYRAWNYIKYSFRYYERIIR